MSYTIYPGQLARRTGPSGAQYLFVNGEAIGTANTIGNYGKFGGGFVMQYAPNDYRIWAEGGWPTKNYDPTNQTGIYDYDTGSFYGTSSDGTNWTFRDNNADGVYDTVLVPTPGWMRGEATIDWVIEDGGTWKAWGHGGNNTGPRAVFYATAANPWGPFTLQNSGNPVLEKGAAGTWDQTGLADVRVFKLGPEDYRMYYRGFNGATGQGGIGYATSLDGITWTKCPGNPVFGPGVETWESFDVTTGAMYYAPDGTMHMWYSGMNNGQTIEGLGYAYSRDWVNWTRGGRVLTPITGVSGQLDEVGVRDWVCGYHRTSDDVFEVHYAVEDGTPPAGYVGYFRGRFRADVSVTSGTVVPDPTSISWTPVTNMGHGHGYKATPSGMKPK